MARKVEIIENMPNEYFRYICQNCRDDQGILVIDRVLLRLGFPQQGNLHAAVAAKAEECGFERKTIFRDDCTSAEYYDFYIRQCNTLLDDFPERSPEILHAISNILLGDPINATT
jgi:hypothetical protein